MQKVKQFYNKNQFVITGGGKITLQSYESTIAEINKKGELTLFKNWAYSKTTLKHFYLFIYDYYMKMNSETREALHGWNENNNHKKYIQNLIDNKKVKYINK